MSLLLLLLLVFLSSLLSFCFRCLSVDDLSADVESPVVVVVVVAVVSAAVAAAAAADVGFLDGSFVNSISNLRPVLSLETLC